MININFLELNDDALSLIFELFKKNELEIIAFTNKKIFNYCNKLINYIISNPYEIIYEIKPHNLTINNIEFFKNGDILTCSEDCKLKVINPLKNECSYQLCNHTGPINDCVIYNNQKKFLSASNDGTLCVESNEENETRYEIICIHDEPVVKCFITKDEDVIACTLSGIINIWDSEFSFMYSINKWQVINDLPLGDDLYYKIQLASRRFQIGISYKIDQHYYIGKGNIITTRKHYNNLNIINLKYKCCHSYYVGHNDRITACCLDKKHNIVSTCYKYIKIWDRWNKNNKKPKISFKHKCLKINILKTDNDGNIVATCSDGTIKCWKINPKI